MKNDPKPRALLRPRRAAGEIGLAAGFKPAPEAVCDGNLSETTLELLNAAGEVGI